VTTYGADVAALRALATTLDVGAHELDASRSAVRGRLLSSYWRGPHADRYRTDWQHRLDPLLASTADSLREAARTLRSDADAQERTSATGGATHGAGPTTRHETGVPAGGPTSTPAEAPRSPDAPERSRLPAFGGGRLTSGDAVRDPDGTLRSPATAAGEVMGAYRSTYDPATGTSTQSFAGEAGASVPAGPVGISFATAVAAESTQTVMSQDGFTTFASTVKGSLTAKGGADVDGYGLELSRGEGLEISYRATVPDAVAGAPGFDASTVSPLDPRSIPVGASVQMDDKSISDEGSRVSFKVVNFDESVATSEGVSKLVERVDEHHVRLTAGPTSALELAGSVGVELEGIRAALGQSTSVENVTARTAVFDLSTTEGQDAYDRALATGDMPTDGAGVSGSLVVEKLSDTHKEQTILDVYGQNLGSEFVRADGNMTRTVQPDGSAVVDGTIDIADGARQLAFSQTVGPSGQTDAAGAQYVLRVPLTGDSVDFARMLTTTGPAAAEGRTLEISLDGADVEKLSSMGYSYLHQDLPSGATVPSGPLAEKILDFHGDPVTRPRDAGDAGIGFRRPGDEFLGRLVNASAGDNGNVLESLWTISERDGDGSTNRGTLPGTARIVD